MKKCRLFDGIEEMDIRVWHVPALYKCGDPYHHIYQHIGITGSWIIDGEEEWFHIRKYGAYYAIFTEDMDDNISLTILKKDESYRETVHNRALYISVSDQYMFYEQIMNNNDFINETNNIIEKYIRAIKLHNYDLGKEIEKKLNFYEVFESVIDTDCLTWNMDSAIAIKDLYNN